MGEKEDRRMGEMTQSINWPLCKPKDLSVGPQHPPKDVVLICD